MMLNGKVSYFVFDFGGLRVADLFIIRTSKGISFSPAVWSSSLLGRLAGLMFGRATSLAEDTTHLSVLLAYIVLLAFEAGFHLWVWKVVEMGLEILVPCSYFHGDKIGRVCTPNNF